MKRYFLTISSFIISLVALHGQSLSAIESCEYDASQHRFFVSNQSNVVVVNGSGTPISYFGTAPQADYGMEVMNGMLFTIVGSTVRAYELTAGMEQMNVTISGAQFLNGMASDGDHLIWVTDFGLKKIHQIDVTDLLNPVVTTLVANTVTTPNGIVYDNTQNRLLFVNWGSNAKVKQVSLPDGAVTDVVATGLTNCDGIDNDAYGHYFISSWSPAAKITRYNSDFSVSETITVTNLLSPADICYAKEIDTLIIPNTGFTNVLFVGFPNAAGTEELATDSEALRIYPNPSSDVTFAEFNHPINEQTRLYITDICGNLVKEILHTNLPVGHQKVIFDVSDLAQGVYICRVIGDSWESASPFVR